MHNQNNTIETQMKTFKKNCVRILCTYVISFRFLSEDILLANDFNSCYIVTHK